MNTGIARDLELARDKAQYDENAKRLLGSVWILAWILKCSIQEFRDIPLGKIVRECICGEILISKVRMEPGTTNTDKTVAGMENHMPERVFGDNTEDKVPGEEKKRILSEDYGIAMEYEQEEGMKNMCNLSEGIYERGIERGKLLNCISIIRSKIAKGKDIVTIAEFMEESVEFVQKIACLLTEKPALTDMDIVDSLSMN